MGKMQGFRDAMYVYMNLRGRCLGQSLRGLRIEVPNGVQKWKPMGVCKAECQMYDAEKYESTMDREL